VVLCKYYNVSCTILCDYHDRNPSRKDSILIKISIIPVSRLGVFLIINEELAEGREIEYIEAGEVWAIRDTHLKIAN